MTKTRQVLLNKNSKVKPVDGTLGRKKTINPGDERRVLILKAIATQLRKDVIAMLFNAGSGHTAGSLGMADIFAALYFDWLRIDPKQPYSVTRDRLFLSNGHICPILYASLANRGFFPKEELMQLRKFGGLLQGHPHNNISGVENSSGPLGQGCSMAVGAAMILSTENKNNHVVAICGDGELNEGQMWEAILCASKYKLSNMVLIVDRNRIQLDGTTEEVMPLDPLGDKFTSFGWDVIELEGNNMSEIVAVLDRIRTRKSDKPLVIIAETTPGCGVSFIEGDYHWHGKVPNKEETKTALVELQAEMDFWTKQLDKLGVKNE